MKSYPLALAALAGLALAGCDQPKPRHVPRDPMALAPAAASAPTEGLTHGLKKRTESGGFSLDHVGQAFDPLNRQPAVTPAAAPTVLDGYGFDPVAQAPGMGVDLVVDGKLYGANYGQPRQDVADYFKRPGLAKVGFVLTLPAGALEAGAHTVVVRVVAADGSGYFESPPVPFQVN